MKIYQSWKRNLNVTEGGYSLTVTYVYSSKYLHEIEEIEKKLINGTIVMDTDKPKQMHPLEQEVGKVNTYLKKQKQCEECGQAVKCDR